MRPSEALLLLACSPYWLFTSACVEHQKAEGWRVSENVDATAPSQEQPTQPSLAWSAQPISEPARSMPGTAFDWAPDDVTVHFHTHETALPPHFTLLPAEPFPTHDHDYEFSIAGMLGTGVRSSDLGGPSYSNSGITVWVGIGGPFLSQGLHMFECRDNDSEYLWQMDGWVARCRWSALQAIFGMGSPPAYETHTDPAALPPWLREFYAEVPLRLEDPNAGILTYQLVEEPDYPVHLDLFVYVEALGGKSYRTSLFPFDDPVTQDVHDRLFVYPCSYGRCGN